MLNKNSLFRLTLVVVFLLTIIVNSYHAVEFCFDDCDEAVSTADHSLVDIGNEVLTMDPEQKSDCDCSDHQHGCCHQHNFLSSGRAMPLVDCDKRLVGVTPGQMLSDPHTRSPFQPPKI